MIRIVAVLQILFTGLAIYGTAQDPVREIALARLNCQGLPGNESLLALLDTEEGRRALRDSALRLMGLGPQDLLTKPMMGGNQGGEPVRALPICGLTWFDWIPWFPCRVQSPPPRPDFLDEARDEGEESLCRPHSARGLSEHEKQKKKQFEDLEREFNKKVDLRKLTEGERAIHFIHASAVKNGHFTYEDPQTNEKILTRLRHFLKGKCCGKSCRHCIYEHSGVVDEEKKNSARFNSSFWIYEEVPESNSAEHDVLTYGRGPYPRKYSIRGAQSMIRIGSSEP